MKLFNYTPLLSGFCLAISMHYAYSIESFNKDWTVATVMGSFTSNPSFKYYFEPQLRLIDNASVFDQLLLLGGVGYQINSQLLFLLGPGWITTKSSESHLIYENRYWEQLNWQILKNSNLNLHSRSRLEERQRTTSSGIALRFRERLWLRLPLKNLQGFSFSCFDEIFLNLNHPHWTSPYVFEQNRAFLGVSTQLSKSILMDVGYLNQYIHSFTNELNHVLLLSFAITIDGA